MTPENIDHIVDVVGWTIAGILLITFLIWLSKHTSSTYSPPTYSVPERNKFLQPYTSTWTSTTFAGIPEGTKEIWAIEHCEYSKGDETDVYTVKKAFLTRQAAYDALESTKEEIVEERNLPWNSQAYADVYENLRVRKVKLDAI